MEDADVVEKSPTAVPKQIPVVRVASDLKETVVRTKTKFSKGDASPNAIAFLRDLEAIIEDCNNVCFSKDPRDELIYCAGHDLHVQQIGDRTQNFVSIFETNIRVVLRSRRTCWTSGRYPYNDLHASPPKVAAPPGVIRFISYPTLYSCPRKVAMLRTERRRYGHQRICCVSAALRC
jgi:hypothetical protein